MSCCFPYGKNTDLSQNTKGSKENQDNVSFCQQLFSSDGVAWILLRISSKERFHVWQQNAGQWACHLTGGGSKVVSSTTILKAILGKKRPLINMQKVSNTVSGTFSEQRDQISGDMKSFSVPETLISYHGQSRQF